MADYFYFFQIKGKNEVKNVVKSVKEMLLSQLIMTQLNNVEQDKDFMTFVINVHTNPEDNKLTLIL